MDTIEEISSLAEEYRIIIQQAERDNGCYLKSSKGTIDELLARDGEWSMEAAEHLSHLANPYGSFMLRNALALSMALQKEDGELGF
ncbi:MAG: hypothetical protein U9R57_15925 [Thermodesulfobacteriota bacterium]|nr:hypothetical protein [Thermodesulfobacteriota bacterium]